MIVLMLVGAVFGWALLRLVIALVDLLPDPPCVIAAREEAEYWRHLAEYWEARTGAE